MKIIFSAILLFAAFAGFSQKRLYPKKFNANLNAVYVTNSTSEKDLSFLYVTPADTSNSAFLIEHLKPSDIPKVLSQSKIYDIQLCRENYKTKVGDFVFSITSENRIIYFYHLADKESSHEIMN